MRRLPVYLLLDTSGSMYGEPIEAVKNGVQTLISTLRSDPYALETAYMGFDNVTDPDLIDCYIYEMNSILKRYRFLLQSYAKNPLDASPETISREAPFEP